MSELLQTIDEFPTLTNGKTESMVGMPLSLDIIFNCSNFIYGGSGCGKTSMIKFMLYLLSQVVGTVIVFCPSAAANNSDYDKIIPGALIHTDLDPKIFLKIYDLQRAKCAEYKFVQDKEVIRSLYRSVASREIDIHVSKANRAYRILAKKLKEELGDNHELEDELTRVRNMITTMKYNIYRKQISKFKKKIPKDCLSHAQQMALKFIDLNPYMLLVFDDCTEELREICDKRRNPKHPECKTFCKFITQGRHLLITTIIVSHDVGSMHKSLRIASHNNFLADSECAGSFFDSSRGMDKIVCKRVRELQSQVYNNPKLHKHNKICYSKLQRTRLYYTHIPPPRKFQKKINIGARSILKELSKVSVEEEEMGIDDDNIYREQFDQV